MGRETESLSFAKHHAATSSARTTFYTYSYTDELGAQQVDTALAIIEYAALVSSTSQADGQAAFLEQLDAFARVNVSLYDQDAHELKLVRSSLYENVSPAILEKNHYTFFLEGVIHIPSEPM